MTTFAVARMLRGQPRLFTGEYDLHSACFTPVTTGRPDEAKGYDDHNIAQVVADLFNALDGLKTATPQRNWIPIELPEAWL
ncbi:MAG: hypothetical protein Q7V17_15010 [Afipia sp.]|nr:hypothetical protein [Afipia sp.]